MIYPPLTIMLLTYAGSIKSPRSLYARRALTAVLEKLTYSGPLYVHIADDGSHQQHINALIKIVESFGDKVTGRTHTNAARSGYGASYNQATQVVHNYGGVVLPLEDDWELAYPLQVDAYIEALMSDPPIIGCIRLGYLGFTQELRGSLGHIAGRSYLVFDPASPERHVAAGHPRLETVEWERGVGPWPERIDPGTTEHVWCGYEASRHGVAWPMDTPGNWFHHIGTVQARQDQQEAVAV